MNLFKFLTYTLNCIYIVFIELLYQLIYCFGFFFYLLDANRQNKLPMLLAWTKINISRRGRSHVHMHILPKVMPRPWLSRYNSDSDYINLWITRKQSLGYIRISLSVPLSARLLESKIEKEPRGIRGEKSSKDMASSRNLKFMSSLIQLTSFPISKRELSYSITEHCKLISSLSNSIHT